MSSYFCEKCGIVHSKIQAPLEFLELPDKYRNKMTLADCEQLLSSLAHKKPMTAEELMERIGRIEERMDKTRRLAFEQDIATASLLDIFKILCNRYNKICYDSPFARILRILSGGRWLSMERIRKEYGSKYVDYHLKVTHHWLLTHKSKKGREVLYRITSKGEAFLRFVDKAKMVLPEGTSIFDKKVSRLKKFL